MIVSNKVEESMIFFRPIPVQSVLSWAVKKLLTRRPYSVTVIWLVLDVNYSDWNDYSTLLFLKSQVYTWNTYWYQNHIDWLMSVWFRLDIVSTSHRCRVASNFPFHHYQHVNILITWLQKYTIIRGVRWSKVLGYWMCTIEFHGFGHQHEHFPHSHLSRFYWMSYIWIKCI